MHVHQEFKIYQKKYEKAVFSGRKCQVEPRLYHEIALRNIISDPQISSAQGNKELSIIFSDQTRPFDYPKPTTLLKKILQIKNKDALVLDFFAGSGTTGHAVMDLNRQDGGTRKFILVTNKENNIDQVCYERLHRIIKGVGTKGETDFT